MDASEPLLAPGDSLDGRYVVERVIGAGGMGVVVAARHTILRTPVAIKVLSPEAAGSEESVDRFHREARLAVRIASRHAARVHDVGRLANGRPYMVMDLLEGQDLAARLEREGPIPPREAVGYVLQALDALQEAHALGIIHRDLKPSNLFLADQPAGPPIVKVLDFGIACDFETSNEPRLTRTGDVMGSPAYMSPEQMRSARSVDARSDVWSVGACLYELLTGRLPFGGKTLADLCANVQRSAPDDPAAWRPGLSPALSAIVLRCLAKDPARRFPSAADLARELVAWRDAHAQEDLRATVPLAPSPADDTHPATEPLPRARTVRMQAPFAPLPSAPPAAPRRAWIPIALAVAVVASGAAVLAVRLVARTPTARPSSPAATTATPAAPAAPPAPAGGPAPSAEEHAAVPEPPPHPPRGPASALAKPEVEPAHSNRHGAGASSNGGAARAAPAGPASTPAAGAAPAAPPDPKVAF